MRGCALLALICLFGLSCLFLAIHFKTRPPTIPDVSLPAAPPKPARLPTGQNAAELYAGLERSTALGDGLQILKRATPAGLPVLPVGKRVFPSPGSRVPVQPRRAPLEAEADLLVMLRRFSLAGASQVRSKSTPVLGSRCASLGQRLDNAPTPVLEKLRVAADSEPGPELVTMFMWEASDWVKTQPRARRGLDWEIYELSQGRKPGQDAVNYGVWASVVVSVPLVNLLAPPLRLMHGERFDEAIDYSSVSRSLAMTRQWDDYAKAKASLAGLREALDKELALRRSGKVPVQPFEVAYVADASGKAVHVVRAGKAEKVALPAA